MACTAEEIPIKIQSHTMLTLLETLKHSNGLYFLLNIRQYIICLLSEPKLEPKLEPEMKNGNLKPGTQIYLSWSALALWFKNDS